MREPAHGLGKCLRAMARRGRLFAGPRDFGPLGICTHIGVGILVWARDATDFRPSMNGAGGAFASWRMVWEGV